MKTLDILELDRMINILQRRCEAQNVSLEWIRYGGTPTTTGKTISLPLPKLPITEEEMTKVYGYAIHEAGHHSRPEAFDILHKNRPGEALGSLFNIMEDDGMEREVALAHRGDAVALGASNQSHLDIVSDNWKRDVPHNVEFTKQQVAPLAACTMGQLSRTSWDHTGKADIDKFVSEQHPMVLQTAQELVDAGFLERMLKTKTPNDTWDLACDMYKWFYPKGETKPDEPKKPDKPDESGSSDEDGDSDSDEEAGKGQSNPEPTDEQGKGTAKEREDEVEPTPASDKAEGTVVSWKEASFSDHDNWKPTGPHGPMGTVGIDWEGYTEGTVGVMPSHLVNVMDMRTKQYTPSTRFKAKPIDFMADNKDSAMFGNKVRRYLQAKERTAVTRDKMHGILDKGSIIKLALPPIDKGNWNRKLFYTKTERQGMDTCVLVLTDWSGSMKGDKMKAAADASGRLVHVFDRVLRVPVQLAAFTNSRTKCDIGLIKGFKDRNIPPAKIAENFSKFYQFSRANNDADALLWAYREIMKRKEKRKIIMVLSDGAPAGTYYGCSSSNLRAATKAVTKSGAVELHGVGIKSRAVKEYYENYTVIQNTDEINQKLFEIIKQGDKR